MKTVLNINGQQVESMKFKTKKAAQNFMNNGSGRTMLFFRAHEYYVSI